ncbi:MAG: hypothetical protein AAF560_13995 [Acidobacteriota bacterium]
MTTSVSRSTRYVGSQASRLPIASLTLLTLLGTLTLVSSVGAREHIHRGTRAEFPVPKDLSFGVLKETAADPMGDTLGGTTPIDIESFSVDAAGGELMIGLTFFTDISAPDSGEANALDGYIDLDTDQVASPDDNVPWVDVLTEPTTGMGNEYYVELFTYSSVDGMVDVVDEVSGTVASRVPMTLSSRSIDIVIPLSVLGDDDGAVNAAAVVFPELEDPTDKVPNVGNLSSNPGTGNPNTVFLRGNRFTVDVEWTDPGGVSGPGKLITQSDDSALLYFFSPNNWEMLIKVLDGCDINNRNWVFFAATTDVAFTLTVTDTQAEVTQVYQNPQGQAANAITDTDAFDTCP